MHHVTVEHLSFILLSSGSTAVPTAQADQTSASSPSSSPTLSPISVTPLSLDAHPMICRCLFKQMEILHDYLRGYRLRHPRSETRTPYKDSGCSLSLPPSKVFVQNESPFLCCLHLVRTFSRRQPVRWTRMWQSGPSIMDDISRSP